ncbi:dipeptidase [Reyranella sp. CPCC 100927]|uniref:dipeptidase n=1 Tax=Reyranella sp. CPCC 100927 TaxID=2599616 RepID=UPI0011B40292|nr:membrane dipeptidase [Reyranella sp. CPCC 100927]TWT15742.1 peptidase M19 [Reyranella sp. CPCC 100927]
MLIDGLQCGSFDRGVFEDLRAGGFTCVTPTLGFWEGAIESLDAIGEWRDLARAHADVVSIVRSTDDILAAHKAGRIALLLGYQNTNLLDGRIRYVELFAELGVRVLQLTYNNQNELGSSCYETVDPGLARFGREVVREMNQCGMLIDLSHVGDKTTLDAIEWSQKPVAITHANPASVFPHKRNKNDAIIKALAAKGGIIGCAAYRNITPEPACDSVDAWAQMVARTVDIAGIDHVGIGTDFSHHSNQAYLDWMRSGRWTRTVQYGAGSAAKPGPSEKPAWLKTISGLASVAPALARIGFNADEVEKITAGNWLRVYRATIG